MLDAVLNPRRAPRVRTDLAVDVKYEGDVWQSVTRDFGPGGCSLVVFRRLVPDTPVQILVRGRKVKESLVVDGRVVWASDRKAGVAFVATGRDADPARWFRLLLAAHPGLLDAARQLPDRVRGDEFIVRCPSGTWRDVDLTTNELMVLARIDDGASVAVLGARTQLGPGAFARALFALLEKGVIERASGDLPN